VTADLDGVQLAAYDRVCESYHKVDDFRARLLGLLPVATGTGVFLLLSGKAEFLGQGNNGEPIPRDLQQAFGAIGAFGLLFALGLFAYELFGIKKCHYLIESGKRLETRLGVWGQFRTRPSAIAGYVNEPAASSIIYPASMAAWLFLGLFTWIGPGWAAVLAVVVIIVGCYATIKGARLIGANQQREARVVDALTRNGPMPLSQLLQQSELQGDPVERIVRDLYERGVLTDGDQPATRRTGRLRKSFRDQRDG
jgi:hypothetical protein